jgi:hypothetical protein
MEILDFLNQNSLRNYPIKDGQSRVSADSLFVIPNTFIVDLSLSANGVNTSKLYISKIANLLSSINIEISVIGGAVLGIFYISLPNSTTNFDVTLTSSASYPDAAGLITIGTVEDMSGQPSGEFTFNSDSTELLARCYSIGNNGVTRINFLDGQGNDYTLTGDVVVQANSNIQFKSDGSTVYLNAGENLGLNKQCPSTEVPIKTINGVYPDSAGNFSIITDSNSCLSLTPIQYGALLADNCGKPCLGCGDIDTLTGRVNTLENDIYSIRDFINNLQSAISQANLLIAYQCQCDQ